MNKVVRLFVPGVIGLAAALVAFVSVDPKVGTVGRTIRITKVTSEGVGGSSRGQ